MLWRIYPQVLFIELINLAGNKANSIKKKKKVFQMRMEILTVQNQYDVTKGKWFDSNRVWSWYISYNLTISLHLAPAIFLSKSRIQKIASLIFSFLLFFNFLMVQVQQKSFCWNKIHFSTWSWGFSLFFLQYCLSLLDLSFC